MYTKMNKYPPEVREFIRNNNALRAQSLLYLGSLLMSEIQISLKFRDGFNVGMQYKLYCIV